MTGGNCSVLTCSSSDAKLNPWKKNKCSLHGVEQRYCRCGCPFRLFCFPSKLRNSESRACWLRAMRRINPDKSEWEPSAHARVCSKHFVDGEPTLGNPDPTINLGYDRQIEKPRRVIVRKPIAKKRKLNSETQEIPQEDGDPPSLNQEVPPPVEEQPANNQHLSTDHDYHCVTKKCDGCADKDALVKSLVDKINRLTIQNPTKKSSVVVKYSGFSHKKIKSDSRMSFYTGLSSISVFHTIFAVLEPHLSRLTYWRGKSRCVSTKLRRFSQQKRKLSQKK